MYYEEIKTLLDGKRPSVRNFKNALTRFSAAEQEMYYRKAYQAMLSEWAGMPEWYLTFFIQLVRNDWQRFLDFLLSDTILGQLRYSLQNATMFKKVCSLLERHTKDTPVSYNHLAFAISLCFQVRLKISTFSDQLRTSTFYPEELMELLERAVIAV